MEHDGFVDPLEEFEDQLDEDHDEDIDADHLSFLDDDPLDFDMFEEDEEEEE